MKDKTELDILKGIPIDTSKQEDTTGETDLSRDLEAVLVTQKAIHKYISKQEATTGETDLSPELKAILERTRVKGVPFLPINTDTPEKR